MKRRHREMKELAILRKESRKSCGWSSALCIIPFCFLNRQCTLWGILHSVNAVQALACSNLTTVFFCIFFHDQHIIYPLAFCTVLLYHSSFITSTVWSYLIYCFLQENIEIILTSNTSFSESFVMKEELLARYIGLSSFQDVLWDRKYPSGQDTERADRTLAFTLLAALEIQ